MKWEYFGTGLAFIGIGVTFMLALPPPGWPRMPPPLVHIGIIIGATLTIIGAIIAIFGMWPVFPNPKIPVLGMGLTALLFVVCMAWFWVVPEKSFPPANPLKRLIVYRGFDLIVPWSGTEPKFHGYNILVFNVSNDTITARQMFLNVDIDDVTVLAIPESGAQVIIQQTSGKLFGVKTNAPEDVPISMDAKAITVKFEIDYDTIPESGIRKSYRKFIYPINWANGKNNPPLLEAQNVDEWEK